MATSTLCSFLAASALLAAPAAPAAPIAKAPAAPSTKVTSVKPAATPAREDAAAWAGKVQAKYEGVKNYAADFEQVGLLKGAGVAGPKATGRVRIQKPGRMRWEFENPEKKIFVSDGKTLWIYEVEEHQVIVQEDMAETTSMTALNFLDGLGKLEEDFDVSLSKARQGSAYPGHVFLSMVPKPAADVQLSEIVLAVDRKTFLADEVYLIDALGNETRLAFKNGKVNATPEPGTFTFEIPEGAEVIRPPTLR